MINKLAGQDMGQQAGTCNGLGDNLRGNRGYFNSRAIILYAFTAFTGILGTDVANNLYPSRNDIKLL